MDRAARAATRGDELDVAFALHGRRGRRERLARLHRREELVPAPFVGAAVDEAGPCIDLDLVRADVVHAVHGRRAAEHLAARP